LWLHGACGQVESAFNTGAVNEANRKAGDVSMDKIGPPWVTSHLGLKAFEADMKASIEKLTEGPDDEVLSTLLPSHHFARLACRDGSCGALDSCCLCSLSCCQVKLRLQEAPLEEDFDFDFMELGNTARAMAALEALPRLKELRHKMVPSKMKEEVFWRNYFYQCDIIIKSYLKMCVSAREGGSDPSRYADASDNVEGVTAPADGSEHGKAGQDAGLSWEEEMEQELEGIQGNVLIALTLLDCRAVLPPAVASLWCRFLRTRQHMHVGKVT
jgi:hypothetical protein